MQLAINAHKIIADYVGSTLMSSVNVSVYCARVRPRPNLAHRKCRWTRHWHFRFPAFSLSQANETVHYTETNKESNRNKGAGAVPTAPRAFSGGAKYPRIYMGWNSPRNRNRSPGATSGAGSGASVGASAEAGSRDALDVRYSLAALADDYTKRKHVVRVTTAAGAELLLQAEGAADAQRWLAALRRHSAEPPPEPAHAAPAPAPAPAALAPIAAVTAQECSSPLPPQRTKKIGRNRSPSGPPTPTLPSSPKNKTWKGRVAKQLRRMHGGAAGGAASAPEASGWLGAPLERCPADPAHPLVPLAVTLPATAVEACGLRTVGVYRVPGNAAGVAALAAALNRGEPPPAGDARWTDVHVASSLLKAYLRQLPDPLLTAELYPAFIAADRSPERARELRRLVHALPEAHFETLRYLMRHLRRVVEHSHYNKMEARNLAIVFGPTLVRAASDDMLAMVNDMSSQCRVIESLLTHYAWYFEEDEGSPPREPPPAAEPLAPAPPSRDLLIHNVKKIEGKDVSTRDIVSSIISAANRKIQRKPRPKNDSKTSPASTTRAEPVEKRTEASPGGSPRCSPPASPPRHLTTSLARYDGLSHPYAPHDNLFVCAIDCLPSTTNACGRWTVPALTSLYISYIIITISMAVCHALLFYARRMFNTLLSNNFSVDEVNAGAAAARAARANLLLSLVAGAGDLVSSLTNTFDQKLRTLNNSSPLDDDNIPYADECQDDSEEGVVVASVSSPSEPSEGSVAAEPEPDTERVSPAARAHQLKAAWLARDAQRHSSSSSDETDARYVQPRHRDRDRDTDDSEKENCAAHSHPRAPHDSDKDIDTASQTSRGETAPDNDRALVSATAAAPAHAVPAPHQPLRLANPERVKRNSDTLDTASTPSRNPPPRDDPKLKRSESLSRDPPGGERETVARVLRSESLNCRAERLQRSESLNKADRGKPDKSEWSGLRRRDTAAWRSTKLKRKNGMPERGIKRRHTVGGTKDFDKDNWSARHTRTSSPDLSVPAAAAGVWPAPLVPPPLHPLESHV
ncbi:Rho GTPase-activating protein 21-B [Eumeta japonica]|uniref:Rho GTPase-activating protein 21-B n=1 Tax=Eumeta variegata TaxID=151549 RepID=A0A4C1XSH7_EUMVA|nr:Rho GTPase-activating protein 21-B [Eumeta japonica]